MLKYFRGTREQVPPGRASLLMMMMMMMMMVVAMTINIFRVLMYEPLAYKELVMCLDLILRSYS